MWVLMSLDSRKTFGSRAIALFPVSRVCWFHDWRRNNPTLVAFGCVKLGSNTQTDVCVKPRLRRIAAAFDLQG